MCAWSLKFIPYGKSAFVLDLVEESEKSSEPEYITDCSQRSDCIFSDLSYELELAGEAISDIKEVRVYINDAYEPSVYENGKIWFPGQNEKNRRIFSDCFGFAKVNVELLNSDGVAQSLMSDYLPVLVKREELNESVKAMANYVYRHQNLLSLNGESLPRDLAGLKDSKYRNLAAQIILAEQLATVYEKSYGYFKANSRFQTKKEPTIDYLEHMQYVTPSTIEYTATHPDQLRPVYSGVGIQIGKRVYQPQKTKFFKNIVSYDIYENRVILGFLRLMVHSVMALQEQCKNLLEKIPDNEDYSIDYVYSSFFMFSETRRTLKDGEKQLSRLSKKFAQLYDLYSKAFGFEEQPLKIQPKPTAVFMTVPQYNKIFVNIYQWFNAGIYDFEEEKFMLSFIKISTLYEKYLLAKIYEYLLDCGFDLYKLSECKYPLTKNARFKNAFGNNTFFFSDRRKNITLYYQPVIYNTDKSYINGIGLYRNNSITVNNENYDGFREEKYYTPDFLIKVEDKGSCRYLIADAKFSSIDTVKNYDVKDLVFKYLFSISPVNPSDTIVGISLIYGKCKETEGITSAYDYQLPNYDIVPIVEILPLMEGVANEKQYTNLDDLFKKIL